MCYQMLLKRKEKKRKKDEKKKMKNKEYCLGKSLNWWSKEIRLLSVCIVRECITSVSHDEEWFIIRTVCYVSPDSSNVALSYCMFDYINNDEIK